MTRDELNSILKRKGYSIETSTELHRTRPHSFKEELPLPSKKRGSWDRQGSEEKNGAPRKRYSVRTVFLVSDNRKRDAFGMLETVADALIGAVGRLHKGNT